MPTSHRSWSCAPLRVARRLLCLYAVGFIASICVADEKSPPGRVEPKVSFHGQILPLFRQNCFGCHQGARQLGEYLMTDFAALIKGGETGAPAIVPGDSTNSYLMQQIELVEGVAEMPKPPQEPLSEEEVDLVRRWIEQGAENDSPTDVAPWSTESPPQYTASPTLPSIDVSPSGELVALAGLNEIVLFDTRTEKVLHRLIGLSPRVNSVAFSPDGTRLAAAGGRPGELGEVQVWDIETAELTLVHNVTYDTLSGLAWSPSGDRIAFGGTDNVVRVIDASTGKQVLFQGAHEDWVRDTVFTNDGEHLVSVARDMTCKLTEVETERFIDNITSITPGALSGGLSSIDRHPERDEIVVGGADGVAKVYRVFRQTKRRIGDDANLIRALPALKGRITSVDVDSGGESIAAAATLDGNSQIAVWAYDFDGELTEDVKKILGKRVADRKPEEKKQLEELRSQPTTTRCVVELLGVSVYSVQLTPQDDSKEAGLWVAGNDGAVREYDLDGNLRKEWRVFDAEAFQRDQNPTPLASVGFEPSAFAANERVSAAQSTVTESVLGEVVSLAVEPTEIQIESPYGYVQMIATATLADGSTQDVTRMIEWVLPPSLADAGNGRLRPAEGGQGEFSASLGEARVKVGYDISGFDDRAVDFIRDVNPVLSRLGCNQGTCHGAQKGKNGFRLSLRGYDAIFDLRALTEDLAARRIDPAAPGDSLMLRKPLGLTPHEGGVLMRVDDPYHEILRRWIADGSHLDLETPRVESIDVSPLNPIVDDSGSLQQIRVVARYEDGRSRDVTHEAFVESGNTEVAIVESGARLVAVRRGEAPVLVRYEGAYAATTLTVMGDRSGYERESVAGWNPIDDLVASKWDRMKITPSGLCDDATFVRRVHLDLTGLPPSSDLVRRFLTDDTPTQHKRKEWVERLLGNDAFVEYWTNKWADLLQVNRKFLGVEGSVKFRGWIRKAVEENRPYNQFVSQILTATGSGNDNPPASYYKILRTPEDAMENTTHLFLGIRFNCNKCHDHPFERWTQDQYFEMAAYFAQVDRKRDPASGKRNVGGTAVEKATPLFETIADNGKGDVMHGRTGEPVPPAFPYELVAHRPEAAQTLTAASAQSDAAKKRGVNAPSRREQLADWMTSADNPYFARSYVNRLWAYLTGVGLIEPIDDIRAGNPPTNPALLDFLTTEFLSSGFDTRHVIRLICNSRAYSLSVETNDFNADDKLNYSHAMPRRLPAEVIYDAVHQVTGAVSRLPGMPEGTRAAAASDAGVRLADGFLTNLGRPARESACECERTTDLQLGPVMALVSGPTIGTAIGDQKNGLDKLLDAFENDRELVDEIFLRSLARYPLDAEHKAFQDMLSSIDRDHQRMVDRLKQAEAHWTTRRPKLEEKRKQRLATLKQQLVNREQAIAPERKKMEAERQKKIAEAQKKYDDEKQKLGSRVEKFLEDNSKTSEWFPLRPSLATTSNKATLTMLPDRSVLASGPMGKSSYTLRFKSKLSGITGMRIEALTHESLPGKGPGRATNFVVTEIKVDTIQGKETRPIEIASARADFLQKGFNIDLTFDGVVGNQSAWAVAGANGLNHWATFKFAEPVDTRGGSEIRVVLHQNHNAENHQLGRFRVSFTTDEGEIPLGLDETLQSIAETPTDKRSEADVANLNQFVETTDPKLSQLKVALGTARAKLPPDEQVVRLKASIGRAEKETQDDPALVRLRADVEQSERQAASVRRTAAEDLIWALVNSPAFLFNH
ncbi:MAG: DUF1549 domain-containing protein [Planctomycetota bacterium]